MKIQYLDAPYIDLKDRILYNRGVKNLERLRNPDWEGYVKPGDFWGMEQGVNRFVSSIKQNKNIGILVDCDQDGQSSSAEICTYFPQIQPLFHKGKQHGLTDEEIFTIIKDANFDLLLIPDAGSNDVQEIKTLIGMGTDIIVIDHHPIDTFKDNEKFYEGKEGAIIINCHHPLNLATDINLTGAGMVFKFLELVKKYIDIDLTEVLDLVAIGQIGDASDISINSIRKFVLRGIHNIRNPFIKYAVTSKIGDEVPTTQDMSYGVIPLVNAVCRIGTLEEKKLLFKALSQSEDLKEFEVIKKRKKDKETGKFYNYEVKYTGYMKAYDTLLEVKERQKEIVKDVVKDIRTTNGRLRNETGIAFVKIPKLPNGNITGLIAQKISSDLGKPCLMFQEEDNGILKGSGRSNDKWIDSLKDWCNDSGLFIQAQGHDNAFGVQISIDNYEKAIEKSKEIEKADKTHFVDEIYDNKDKPKSIIGDIEEAWELRDIFGGSITEPLFGFQKIKVAKNRINIRDKVVTFDMGAYKFVSFTPPSWIQDLCVGFDPFVTLNIVGKPMVSEWRGRTQYQIVIEDMEIVEEIITKENFEF